MTPDSHASCPTPSVVAKIINNALQVLDTYGVAVGCCFLKASCYFMSLGFESQVSLKRGMPGTFIPI